jgi:hypothetical protein
MLTGFMFSGVQSMQTTGSALATGKVTKNDGSQISLLYPSGMTGIVTSGEVTIPLVQQVALQTSGIAYTFGYDTASINQMSAFTFEFDLSLTSGDVVEIYNYPLPNANIGQTIYQTEWPNNTGVIQLIANGLNETQYVDYWIVHNAISGYFDSDILTYDVIVGPPVVTAYSG